MRERERMKERERARERMMERYRWKERIGERLERILCVHSAHL